MVHSMNNMLYVYGMYSGADPGFHKGVLDSWIHDCVTAWYNYLAT